MPATPLTHAVDVLILQDPQERLEAKGTAPLLRLGLQSCEVRVGEHFEPSELRSDRQDLLLYPPDSGEPGEPIHRLEPLPPAARLRLIVLDGTWRKSRKLLYQSPWLAALPRLALNAVEPARYGALRKAQRSGQLSTLEATLLALEQLEGARFAPLWSAFEAFIAKQTRRD